MWANSFDRRRFIRDTWKTYGNVGKTVHVVFIGLWSYFSAVFLWVSVTTP